MHDVVIRGGDVVDGSGAVRRRADVAIDDGRISAIGVDVGGGRRTIDAAGRIVAPGFIDVHTHYDVQGFWGPFLSPSPFHGVTTVIGGNCGFSVAPLSDTAGDYLRRMLAKVEGMPLDSLEVGVPWDWSSTAEFLERLECLEGGGLALNAGFMVGHSAIRRVVMGEAATERACTAEELLAMKQLLRAGLDAGGMGFSSTWSESHNDAAGRPVPSRWATAEELVGLAIVCREFEGTSLEFLPGVDRWSEETKQVMVDMTVAAQRPLNWNLIAGSESTMDEWLDKLALSDRAQDVGGKIVGLAVPRIFGVRFTFRSGFVLDSIQGWEAAMALDHDEKLALLSSPEGRRDLAAAAANCRSLGDFPNWESKVIVETFTASTAKYEGRRVQEIAVTEGKTAFDALLDIVVADDLRTSFRSAKDDDSPADWMARGRLWQDPRVVVGASDAGAHLDMLATFSYATDLLRFGVREYGLLSLEEAVSLLTSAPADLYGLRDRGRLTVGACADLVVFDEHTVGPQPVTTRFDLPGGAGRLYAGADGVGDVLVNGVSVVSEHEATEARPGTLLRSGRDTVTPTMALLPA